MRGQTLQEATGRVQGERSFMKSKAWVMGVITLNQCRVKSSDLAHKPLLKFNTAMLILVFKQKKEAEHPKQEAVEEEEEVVHEENEWGECTHILCGPFALYFLCGIRPALFWVVADNFFLPVV